MANSNGNPDVKIVVGLAKKESKDLIKKDLSDLIDSIGKTPKKVKIGINETYLKSEITKAVKNMTITGLKVTPAATVGAGKAGGKSGSKEGNGISVADMDVLSKQTQMLRSQLAAQWKSLEADMKSMDFGSSQYIEAEKRLNALKAAYGNLKQVLGDVKSASADQAAEMVRELTEAQNAAKELLGKELVPTKALTAQNKEIDELKAKFDSLKDFKMPTGASDDLKRAFADLIQASEAFNNTISSDNRLKENFEKNKVAIENAKAAIDNFGVAVKQNTSFADKLAGKFQTVTKQLLGMMSVYRVFMMIRRAIKEVIDAAIEIDDAMTQLKIVTEASETAYSNFMDRATQSARELAVSIKDLITATTTYARLGYSIEESSRMAELTTMLQSVGDIDASSAQDAITSMVKAFGIEIDDLERVMDELVTVGNNFPISVSQLATGMTNASSTLAAAGNSIEESVALLMAANVTIQDAAKSSTGIRTLTARLRNTKVELDELGEDMTESKYEALVQALTDYNVRLVDINGEYRSTYAIMKDIAAQWNSMTSMEQAGLATQIAGVRQQAVFYSIIGQFQEAENAMAAMSESTGAMDRAYDEYLNSITAHINQFKAAFQSFSYEASNTDLMKQFIDLGTVLLDLITKAARLSNTFGGLKTTILAVASAAMLLGRAKLAKNFELIIVGLKTLPQTLTIIGKKIKGFGRSIKEIFTGMRTATDETTRLTQLSTGFTAIATGAMLAVTAITAIVSAIKQYRAEQRQSHIDQMTEATEEARSIMTLYGEYRELEAAVANGTASSEDFISKQDELLEALGIEQYEINNLIDEYGSLSEAIRQATIESLKYAQMRQASGIRELENDVNHATTGSVSFYLDQNSDRRVQQILSRMGYNGTASAFLQGGTIAFDFDTSSPEATIETFHELEDIMSSLMAAGLEDEAVFSDIADVYNRLKTTVDPLIEQYREFNDALVSTIYYESELSNQMPRTAAAFEDFRNQFIGVIEETGRFRGDESLIPDVVDSYLSSLPEFERFYNELDSIAASTTRRVVNSTLSLTNALPQLDREFRRLNSDAVTLLENDPEEFISTLSRFRDTAELTDHQRRELDNLIDSVEALNSDNIVNLAENFGILSDEINGARDAQTRLNELLEGYAEDDLYRSDVENIERINELIEEGYGLGHFELRARAESLGISADSVDELESRMEQITGFFQEGTEGIINFLTYVGQLNDEGLLDTDLAYFDRDTLEFFYDATRMEEFAEATGLSVEMVTALTEAYWGYTDVLDRGITTQEYYNSLLSSNAIIEGAEGGIAFLSDIMEQTGLAEDQVVSLIEEINTLRSEQGQAPIQLVGSDQIVVTQQLVDTLDAAGYSYDEILGYIQELSEYDDVTIEAGITLKDDNDVAVDVREALARAKAEAEGDSSDIVTVTIDVEIDGETLQADITSTVDQIESALGRDWEIILTPDPNGDAEASLDSLQQLVNTLGEGATVTIQDETDSARRDLITLRDLLFQIRDNRVQNVQVNYSQSGSTGGSTARRSKTTPAFAKGTKSAKGGMTLLGDEFSPSGSPKPELVVSDGYAYVAGQNGPEFAILNEGDVVYNADDTKHILSGRVIRGPVPAHGKGTPTNRFWDQPSGSSSGSSGSRSSGSSQSSTASAAKEEAKEAENWFEKAYKYHKHLIEMDQEEMDDYLKWLAWAYKQAYNEGIIELDDFYKYQEEVYSGLQNLFMDYLSDVEHEISMREHFESEGKNIVKIYQKALKEVEKEIKAARAIGLDDTDDYIQKLQDKWWSYYDNITDIREEAEDNAKDAVEELVDIRVKMLKQEIDNEKDAIKERLSNLKDFYDKQKEMLRDSYDEDKYLEEQTEKRKAVSDLQAELTQLEYDDSAWAQKKKLELAEELADAQKSLSDFEKERALKNAEDELDRMQELQEQKYDAQLTALDAREQNAKQLYDQALKDIKNGSVSLYKEMIQWNNTYGDGIQATITEKWEAAYKALKDYSDLYGKSYNGINLANATGYKPNSGPSGGRAIMGSSASAKGTTATVGGVASKPSSSSPAPAAAAATAPAPAQATPAAVPTVGQVVTVKPGTQWWSGRSGGVHMASWVPGSQFSVMQIAGDEVLIGRNGQVTGWILKTNLVGYAGGTSSAIPGLHRVDELGPEAIFTSSDGSKYRLFSGGEKVLSAKATDFLYNFANNGEAILSKIIKSAFGDGLSSALQPAFATNNISMGDIIVQGNADRETVSSIRRAQRDSLDNMLRELNRLSR